MIDLAELRMILAMKRIYYYSYKNLKVFDKKTYQIEPASDTKSAYESEIQNTYVQLSCANGLPNIVNGENLDNIKNSVKDWLGYEPLNFPVGVSNNAWIKGDELPSINLSSGEAYADDCVEFINDSLDSYDDKKVQSVGFAVDYGNLPSEEETWKNTIIDNVKTALEDFQDCLSRDKDGEIGFNKFELELPNSKKCLGGNGGWNWQSLWKEQDKRHILDDYLKVVTGERPKDEYTVIANPILPNCENSFLNACYKAGEGDDANKNGIRFFDMFGINNMSYKNDTARKAAIKFLIEVAKSTPRSLSLLGQLK